MYTEHDLNKLYDMLAALEERFADGDESARAEIGDLCDLIFRIETPAA